MNGTPPPLPPPGPAPGPGSRGPASGPPPQHPISLRLAAGANVLLPGTGLVLIGDRVFGIVLAALFLTCFLGVAGLFVKGYANYLNTALGDDLLKGDRLEKIGDGFHRPWLLSFAAGGILVYAVSSIRFAQVKRRLETPPPAA